MEPGSHDALRGGERPDWGFSRDHGTPVKVLACLVDAIAGKVSPGNRIKQEALIRGCAMFLDDQGGRLITAHVWPGCVVLALVWPGCVLALLLPGCILQLVAICTGGFEPQWWTRQACELPVVVTGWW